MQKLIRIRYEEKPTERLVLEKLVGKESWEFIQSTRFVRTEKESTDDKNFIHYSFMREVYNWYELGYKVIWI